LYKDFFSSHKKMLVILVLRCICQEMSCKFKTKTHLVAMNKYDKQATKKYNAIIYLIFLRTMLLSPLPLFHSFLIFQNWVCVNK